MERFFELLRSEPTAKEILAFKITPEQQDRVDALLEKNKSRIGLSDQELAELEAFHQANHYVAIYKVRAYSELKQVAA